MMNDLEFILNFEENKTKGIWLSGIEGEGEYLRYHKNGQLRYHEFYKNGLRHGESKWYFENGQIWIHDFWKNGLRHGECEWYLRNGELYEHNLYKNGKFVKNL